MGAETWPTATLARMTLRVDPSAEPSDAAPHAAVRTSPAGNTGELCTDTGERATIRAVLFDGRECPVRRVGVVSLADADLRAAPAARASRPTLCAVGRICFCRPFIVASKTSTSLSPIACARQALRRRTSKKLSPRRVLNIGTRKTRVARCRASARRCTACADAELNLGVATNLNRSAAALRADLVRLRLDGVFDCVLTSLDLQRYLPDEHCLGQALSTLNCSAEETLYVGHDTRELSAARACGLAAVGFNMRAAVEGVPQIERFEGPRAAVDSRK